MLEIKQPKIRFKGHINDWEQRKLWEVVSKQIKGKTKFESLESGNVEYLDTARLNGGIPILTNALNDVETDDIIILWDGSKAGTVYTGFSGALGSTLKAYKTNVNGQFVYQFLKLHQENIYNNYRTPNIPHVQKDFLDVFNINVPNLGEQQKIGDFFKTLDDTITLHQQKLEVTKQFKQTMLKKMFPKNGETTPEIRFKGFTEDWGECKVNEIFKVTRGKILATTETNEEQSETMPYPVYSSQTKNGGIMGYYKDYLFDTAITWTTDGANAGTVNYRNGKFYSTNVNGVLLSEEGYANKAIAEILNREAWKWVSHVGNPKLMNNVMGDIAIYIPPSFEEQNIISEFFLQLDEIITSQKHKLEVIKQFKQTMLRKLFI